MRLVLAALAASLLLVACSPEYNWREIRAPEHGYAVMLPGKPATMTRGIRLGEVEVSMTMQGARAGGASFTVATALLPDDSPTSRENAVAAMRVAMVRNIAGAERAVSPVTVEVVDAGGQRRAHVGATQIEASGTIRERAVTMLAGFVASGARAHQWVALGGALDREQARTFLDSFRLIEPQR
ncbi:MAG: hypothetical protein KJZ83_08670 [Burkholderiaceae bacterium]|nr:hypothetical protein [Burkholderiaceae bacterium]